MLSEEALDGHRGLSSSQEDLAFLPESRLSNILLLVVLSLLSSSDFESLVDSDLAFFLQLKSMGSSDALRLRFSGDECLSQVSSAL